DGAFQPARPALTNPTIHSRPRGMTIAPGTASSELTPNLVQDKFARAVADVFDGVYVLMLRMLAYVFASGPEASELATDLSRQAIRLMPTVIKPLGEALTLLPSGIPNRTAGPGFGLTRHVALPENPRIAGRIVKERIDELAARLKDLAAQPRKPS